MKRKAIVTLAVGQRMLDMFQRYYRPTWEDYAARHDYDIVVFDRLLDTSEKGQSRCVAWQKCLVLEQVETMDRERVVWLDADIVIRPGSPDVAEGVPLEKIGAVDQWNTPTPSLARAIREAYAVGARRKGVDPAEEESAMAYHTKYGLPSGFASVVQTGMMVLHPRAHREVMAETYAWDRPDPYHYEMPVLSYEIQKRDMAHWMDARFNVLWLEQLHYHYPWIDQIQSPLWERLLRKATIGRYVPWLERELRKAAQAVYGNSWFMHFAGSHPDARLLERWR